MGPLYPRLRCKSNTIKELEKELGVKLFEKDSRHIKLTIYGEQFLPYAERILSMLDEGVNVLHQMAGSAQQIIRLGYFHSISASLIPSIMLDIYGQDQNQNIRFQFAEAASFDYAPATLPGCTRTPSTGKA